MPSLNHLYEHIRRHGLRDHPLYLVAVMIFFWTLFDGIMSFIVPLVITDFGVSQTMMGIIIGSSSVVGALFDFLICRFLTNTNFRRTFLITFILSLIFPFLLWQAKIIWLYLLAVAVWGVYYDFFNIARFDFVSRQGKDRQHSAGFGVLGVFSSLGYLVAPLIAGFFIISRYNFLPMAVALVFLGFAVIFYIGLIVITRKAKAYNEKSAYHSLNFLKEFRLWKRLGRIILPVLGVTLLLNITDAFFWTIGPLLSDSLKNLHGLGSLFMVAYMLPSLAVGWFVGSITRRVGQKRTAILSILIGSFILSLLAFAHSDILMIIVSFIASSFIALAWPAINGAYGDYIEENRSLAKEIETLEDSFTNLGYVIGPILAGLISDHFGLLNTFSLLGIFGIVIALILLKVTPKSIDIDIARS